MMSLFLALTIFMIPTQMVYAADITISSSASSVKIGDSVVVTVSVPDGVTASVDVSYPSDLVQFTTCDATAKDNGNAVSLTLGMPFSKTAKITFSTKAAGTADFSAISIKAGDELGDEVTLGGAATSVTIENQASVEQPVVLSNDNSLGSLQISNGTLSPAFHPDTTNYKVTVGYDVTKVSVSAVAAHEKAKIASVSGGSNLQVGENTINIAVQAENGVTREYKIVVTRQQQPATQQPQNPDTQTPDSSEEPSTEGNTPQTQGNGLSWNGSKLEFVKEIPKKGIPKDFEKTTRVINNKEVSVLDFKNGKLIAVYLSNKDGENGLYVYDANTQDVYPFVSLGDEENYVIVLRPDDANVPAGYVACTLSIEGKGVISAYQFYSDDVAVIPDEEGLFGAEVFYAAEPSASDFYLMYCMNAKGNTGWYLYDIREKTFQRYASALYQVEAEEVPETDIEVEEHDYKPELEKAKKTQLYIVMIAAGVVIILLIIIIVLAIKLVNRSMDDEYEDDNYIEDTRETESEIEIEFYEIPQEKRTVKKITEFDDDDSDLEFIDLD